MLTVLQMLREVSGRAGKKLEQTTDNGESLKAVLLRGFNLYNKDFNNRYLWPWRWKTLTLQTIANYETGTVSVTNGSRTVTGSGTSWTTAMEGRFFKLKREDELYKILSVPSATSLVLEKPYLEATGSGLAYLIWAKHYVLDPEVPYVKHLHLSRWPHEADPIERRDMDSTFIRGYDEGFPEAWALSDINRKVVDYTAGSVSASVNSRTLTGSATSWLDNAYAGSEVIVGGNTYNVESVDSDTQITFIQRVTAAIPSGTNYTLRTRNRTQIVLSSVPDPAVNLYLRYPARQYELINDLDESPVWEGMEHIVLDCLYGYLLEKFTSDDSYNWLKIYRQEANEAWAHVQEMNPVSRIVKNPIRTIPHGYRRALYGG